MTSPIRLLKNSDIFPKKQFGQNFLADPSTAEMIVSRSHLEADDIILEIGAGLGALTVPLARSVRKVHAVEKDSRLIHILESELHKHDIHNVILINKNILDMDITTLSKGIEQKIIIIGNLPYNISSQILVKLIYSRKSIERAILMFQQELAERITAKPGGRDYGRLSVMLQYCADIKTVARIKAALFFPKPKVDSEILEIRFKESVENPADNEAFFFNVIKAAFTNRRKTLKNSLCNSGLAKGDDIIISVLEKAGIDPSRRAETLSIGEFVGLSNCLWRLMESKTT